MPELVLNDGFALVAIQAVCERCRQYHIGPEQTPCERYAGVLPTGTHADAASTERTPFDVRTAGEQCLGSLAKGPKSPTAYAAFGERKREHREAEYGSCIRAHAVA